MDELTAGQSRWLSLAIGGTKDTHTNVIATGQEVTPVTDFPIIISTGAKESSPNEFDG